MSTGGGLKTDRSVGAMAGLASVGSWWGRWWSALPWEVSGLGGGRGGFLFLVELRRMMRGPPGPRLRRRRRSERRLSNMLAWSVPRWVNRGERTVDMRVMRTMSGTETGDCCFGGVGVEGSSGTPASVQEENEPSSSLSCTSVLLFKGMLSTSRCFVVVVGELSWICSWLPG